MAYCTISDLRDEGVPETGYGGKSDVYLTKVINRVALMIDRYTGRWFEPRTLTLTLDGTGSRILLIGDPIISITSIKIGEDFTVADEIDLDDVRIYNRHISQNLREPDDRESPRIEFVEFDHREESLAILGECSAHSLFNPSRWSEGTQNVQIIGAFGYTDYDSGEAQGITPVLIERAAVLMSLRDMRTAYTEVNLREDDLNRWKVTKLKTRDQAIEYDKPSSLGNTGESIFTGDPEIDRILMEYLRPPHYGSV